MPTYPNEAWPADSAVLEMDGTIDVATGLPFIAKGTGPTSSPSYEIQYNRRQLRQNKILAGFRQGMVVDEGGLRIGVYPMEYTLGGQRKSFPGATGVVVPDNSQRVAYLDIAGGLQVAAQWPADPTSYLPLAEITAVGGALTVIDRRAYAVFSVPAERQHIAAFCAELGSNQNAFKIFEFDPPRDMVLEEVQVFCTSAVASASVEVRQAGASLLTAAATLSGGNVVKPAIAQPSVSAASNLSVHVTTNLTGSVNNLAVTLIVRG